MKYKISRNPYRIRHFDREMDINALHSKNILELSASSCEFLFRLTMPWPFQFEQ